MRMLLAALILIVVVVPAANVTGNVRVIDGDTVEVGT